MEASDEQLEQQAEKSSQLDRSYQVAWLREHADSHGEQDENGIDLSLIRENLKLTPTQRLDRLQAFVDCFATFRCRQ